MAESIVYVHGVPNGGAMWRPFVALTGGLSPDLPGFGRSPKPADGDYTFRGLARFVAELTAEMERYSLIVHDWGSAGLLAALERPEAVDKLVVIDAVPFLPGYRWHTIARIWRTPVAGELFMGLSSRWSFRRVARLQGGDPAVVDALLDEFWPHFDHGTQRAILRLYRSAPERLLEEAGRDLARLAGAKSLVVWGARDPYLPTEFARAYAQVLDGELALVEGAGHWPWLDDPSVVDRVARFVSE
jgi:pimeloyl-ACP methyl ester carboxylesterase